MAVERDGGPSEARTGVPSHCRCFSVATLNPIAGQGGGRVLRLEEWMDIRSLHKEGHSIKEIARQTGRSRNTIRRVLREARPRGFQKPERHSCLDPFKPYLKERFESCGLSAVRLLPEIQPMGYAGSISTLRRYLHSLRPEQERQKKLTVRFETPPGKQAQVDRGYCGRFANAQDHLVPVYAFVRCSASRACSMSSSLRRCICQC
jgi:transposase-like protein